MMETVDVYWSFRSPYSYLATPDMLALQRDYPLKVNLRVVLPIALRSPELLFGEQSAKRALYRARLGPSRAVSRFATCLAVARSNRAGSSDPARG